jgi:hypothetical protein
VDLTLHIEGPYESKAVRVEDEISIGRTELAKLVLDDAGLSRVNTTFFIDDGEAFVSDENSLNGTFLNGEKVVGRPRKLSDGDEIRIGTYTRIRVAMGGASSYATRGPSYSAAPEPRPSVTAPPPSVPDVAATFNLPKPKLEDPRSSRLTLVLIAASALALFIIIFAGVGIYFLLQDGGGNGNKTASRTPQIRTGSVIPVRVVDPLGGEDEDDLDDLISSWEVPEDEIKAENVADVTVASTETADADLNVTAAFLADRQKKALEQRSGETGIRPAALDVPRELFGDGVIKQKAKLREMNAGGYRQPLDFAELAEKRIKKDLIEMPMAAKSFYLDVGGSAPDGPFQSFSFQTGDVDITPGTPKFQILSQLAGNFAGQKYDLNNPADRKQMRMRLLRMFNPNAKPILQELADAYFGKFGRPLRVTSLTRSMDYQILLNRGNPNSFKVRGEGSLPPHTSGCAFDLARKHMTAEEQNFVMQKLAQMEQAGKLDALIEYGANACFHIFIYKDGQPPRM